MTEKQKKFIETVGTLARAEYSNRRRWVLPSVCIAQAALESGWNLGAKTLFGIKGNGNNLRTQEYINGKYITVTAAFEAYPSIAAAVHGYYDLITTSPRYAAAVNNPNYRSAVKAIARGGYATAPNYAETVERIISENNLTSYDYMLATANANVSRETSFVYGKNYRVTPDIGLNVRATPGKRGKIVKTYKKGTIFTCLDTRIISGSIWVKTPSGWVCGYDYSNGKFYAEVK